MTRPDFAGALEALLKGFIDQSSRFLHPVFAGDTLYSTLEVSEVAPNRSTGTGLYCPCLPPLAWRGAGNISAGSGRCV